MNTESVALTVSLLHGWAPVAVQALTAVILVVAIGWRSRRWLLVTVPVAVVVGAATAALARWYVAHQGWADEPLPFTMWLWIALAGFGATVLVMGWRHNRWWRRGMSALTVPLCILCVALMLNQWVGYLPTVSAAWDRLTGAPVPGQTDRGAVSAMQQQGATPVKGTIVSVKIPDDASGFKPRDELVYLPPAWYSSVPPPRLPVVMMIGPEFGQPENWPLHSNAQQTIDNFAAAHAGNTPVFVFVDSTGAFTNDTECVNGPRGNAADHLTKDVAPYVISNFGVSPDAADWGVVGWSTGGTCALMLTVKHPELFSTFVDIDGQKGPNAGSKRQTIARLFGGDSDAWAAFDPKTIMERHGLYSGVSGWFAVAEEAPTVYREGATVPGGAVALPEPDEAANVLDRTAVADYMCALASTHGIECAVMGHPGGHTFQDAGEIFASALPWLAGKLGTPGIPAIPLPGAPPA